MLNAIFRAAIIALSLTLPTSAIAAGCVENVDNTVIFVENGHTYSTNRITAFSAEITQNDLYNSRGIRLTSAGAVLQQYVANRRKSGQIVTDNNFFHSLERRTLLSTSPLYVHCGNQPYLADILNNITNAKVNAAALWVVGFRHPDGSIAFLVSPAG